MYLSIISVGLVKGELGTFLDVVVFTGKENLFLFVVH